MIVPLYLLCIIIFFTVFYVYFNRDPNRIAPTGNNILAPADGKIVSINKEKGLYKIAIFMNLHNVHVQRIPISGKIKAIKKIDGKNLPAYHPNARHNKQVISAIKTKIGNVTVKQMTGLLVRRIKTFVKTGDSVKKGDRLGKINFGSRVELWLPAGKVKLKVKEQDKVLAGLTIVARF